MKPYPNELKKSSAKKPYDVPRLQIYGSLREITNTVTNAGHAFDSFAAPNRTR
jgi:hypothetical protein